MKQYQLTKKEEEKLNQLCNSKIEPNEFCREADKIIKIAAKRREKKLAHEFSRMLKTLIKK